MASRSDFSVKMTFFDAQNHTYKHCKLEFSDTDHPVEVKDLTCLPGFSEDRTLSFEFSAPNNDWRLAIPGLLNNKIPGVQSSLKDPYHYYFNQGTHELYSPYDVTSENPLPPNVYTVVVTCGKAAFYAHFLITTKELNFNEWQVMLKDLCSVSKEAVLSDAQGYGYGASAKSTQAELLKLFSRKIVNTTRFIANHLHSEVITEHRWMPVGKQHAVDADTFRAMSKRPLHSGFIYAPYHIITYNTDDNRWIKYIIRRMLRTARDSGDRNLDNLKGCLGLALESRSLRRVSNIPPEDVSGMADSPSYDLLYRLYQKLQNAAGARLSVEKHQRRLKSTDKLYELWTFTETAAELKSLGYDPSTIQGRTLSSGYRILMTNHTEEISLHVVYDEQINNHESFYNEPLMMFGPHQKPDIRIDIFYKDKVYLGSIILDAKYMSLRNVLNEGRSQGQLIDYRAKAVRSDNHKRYVRFQMPCVSRVVALYPSSSHLDKKHQEYLKILHRFGITTFALRPDDQESISSLRSSLSAIIGNRIEASKHDGII